MVLRPNMLRAYAQSLIVISAYWKVTGRIDFKISISNFWPPGEGFQGFRPQIRLQHAKISMLTSFEVNCLQLKRFPKFCPVAFEWPVYVGVADVFSFFSSWYHVDVI